MPLHLARPEPADAGLNDVVIQASPVSDWFDDNSNALISGLINVVVIIAVALILRAIAGRLIDRYTAKLLGSRKHLASGRAASRVVQSGEADPDVRQAQRTDTIASVMKSATSVVIFGVAFVTFLAQLGIHIGPILASAGVIGLAIAFGAQSLVQDFVAGMFLMGEDQFGVGDVVDTGDAVGTVESVGLRITKIRDLNGGLWYVRNGEIMRVCNMNQEWANAVVELPLDYSVDLEHAKRAIQASIDQFAEDPEVAPKILERPDISGVVGIGNGAVTVRVMVMTRPGEQWALGRALRAHLKNALDGAGIKVAYPLLPLHGVGATQQG